LQLTDKFRSSSTSNQLCFWNTAVTLKVGNYILQVLRCHFGHKKRLFEFWPLFQFKNFLLYFLDQFRKRLYTLVVKINKD